MNELQPIMEENESNQLKPVEEPKVETQINLPSLKDNNKEDLITNLPEWSIEPPIEIKRGE